MKKEIKALWVDALKSGKYQQGKWALREDGKHCCLGVLCDLHAQKFGDRWNQGLYDNHDAATLPWSVMKWAGLHSDIGVYGEDFMQNGMPHDSLSFDNDAGRSFEQIAEIIEREF